ncbi:MAG: 50S ribosomal protein L9 [Acidobacteria bacterium]|nr:MAG: 50S ribosomal protein L9 [Acidobacteriota bacterium]
MEIILREKIEKLGTKGDIVRVSDGYARNFLLPKKLAVLATPANIRQIEQEKAAAVRREAIEKQEAEALAQQLSSVCLNLSRKVGENDVLYGSVTSMDIAEALEAKGFSIDKRRIELPEAVKSLGKFDIPIKLHREVTALVGLVVSKED